MIPAHGLSSGATFLLLALDLIQVRIPSTSVALSVAATICFCITRATTPATSGAEKLVPLASARLGTSFRDTPIVFSVVESVPYCSPTQPNPRSTISVQPSPGAEIVTPGPSVVNPDAVSADTGPRAGLPPSKH